MSQDNDPWGKQPKNNKGNDLEVLFNQLKDALFGKGGNNNNTNNSNDNNSIVISLKLIILGFVVLFTLWVASGFYIVKEGYNGVETFLGKYSQTTSSGPSWHYPYPVGNVMLVDIQSTKTMTVGISSTENENEGQMLTSDENIVDISLAVQYRILSPEKYLFNVNNPELVLKETIISSIREAVGSNGVDHILTTGRDLLA